MSGSASDRSWTIAPTLLWFSVALCAGLVWRDGGVQAIADRLTTPRGDGATQIGAGGPAFAAPQVVATADDDDDADADSSKLAGGGGAGSGTAESSARPAAGALEDTCLEGTPAACKRWAMDPFYRAIANEKSGKLGRPVRVSWYGDSVVATDAIPGRLRARLQGELGDGGPGFVFIVPPHRFCGHEAITRSSGGSWASHAISTMQTPDGLYGVGGATAETEDGRATIKLVAGKATSVDLHYLAQPHGGTAVVIADGTEVVKADTVGDAKAPRYAAATISGGAQQFKIETTGRVRLFGIDLENASGAVVDNLGIVSVNVKSWGNANPADFAAGLGHRGADLVMIMIGANEAQWLGAGDTDTKVYAANYEKVLGPIRKARPDAACLVVSPTDQAEAKDTGYVSRPVMAPLIAEQRKAAHASGCAFFSTYDWMGGRGSAAKWFTKGYVGSDFQHLTRKGANKMADAVFDALMTGSKRYAAP